MLTPADCQHRRAHRRLLLALAAVTFVLVACDALTGCLDGLLHVAPFLTLLVPLVFGRYIGEDLLELLRRPVTRLRPPRSVAARIPRHRARALRRQRRGLALALRPPPVPVS